MKFRNCQLIIADNIPTIYDLKKVCDTGLSIVKDYGNDWYEVERTFVEDRFLWIYCEHDNSKLYNEKVLNGENDSKEDNPRMKSQVELRKQLFICYDTNTNLLYLNNIDKRGFLRYYISHTLQKNVVTKNIYSTLEDFQNTVKRIKTLKFTQVDNLMNRMPDSIFQQQANIYGLDFPSKITLQVDYGASPIDEVRNALQSFKRRKEAGEFESIVLIGLDDQDVEESFDFSSMMKAVEISVEKDENNRYDPAEVRTNFLNIIR